MTTAPNYAAHRPYAAPPANLAALTGPMRGKLQLPKRLDWGPPHTYDVAVAQQRRAMYEVVLQEAATTSDVEQFVNGDLLAMDWNELRLPRRVRTAWEQRLPVLVQSS